MVTKSYMERTNTDPNVQGASVRDPFKTKGQRAVEQGFKGGQNPTAGPNKTPAPTRQATPDDLRSRAWGRESYGANGAAYASSLEPGETASASLKVTAPDDPMLAAVIERGTANSDVDLMSSQLRTVDATQLPASFGMRSRSDPKDAVKIPSATGAPVNDDSAQRRAQALRRA